MHVRVCMSVGWAGFSLSPRFPLCHKVARTVSSRSYCGNRWNGQVSVYSFIHSRSLDRRRGRETDPSMSRSVGEIDPFPAPVPGLGPFLYT